MIYLVGFKILDKTKESFKKNIELFTCRKPFVVSYDYNEVDNNEEVLFQLLQDIDYREKVKKKNILHCFIVNINPKILPEGKRVTKNITQIAKNYSCELANNKIKKLETVKKEYIRHICDFTIDYDMLLQQMQRNEPKEDIHDGQFTYEYKICNPFNYPYQNLLYMYFNHNNEGKQQLASLPIEIIDKILYYLKSEITINFMSIYPGSFFEDNFLLITPSVTVKKNILSY